MYNIVLIVFQLVRIILEALFFYSLCNFFIFYKMHFNTLLLWRSFLCLWITVLRWCTSASIISGSLCIVMSFVLCRQCRVQAKFSWVASVEEVTAVCGISSQRCHWWISTWQRQTSCTNSGLETTQDVSFDGSYTHLSSWIISFSLWASVILGYQILNQLCLLFYPPKILTITVSTF